ncbi:MAG: glycoside hydrolase family 38 C-terminal domain-containing protein [bacterium]
MARKSNTLILVCNAHLDPVWLWEWEEGLAETLSTFRTAARLCEEFDGFVFCHNESLPYEWTEEHEPDLFKKIQKLVKNGKWHIMGGWFLQPDCNMPSGESFIRQILLGKLYFKEKFSVVPKTAVNFDPFGHSRGLVQILKKSGYDSYLFCRPDAAFLDLPADDFVWVGYDGSEILAHRARHHYNSMMGKARQKVEKWTAENPHQEMGLLLWGIGNHGGGPSREDLTQLRQLIKEETGWCIQHGTPEAYFQALKKRAGQLSRHTKDLNPWAVGCYTSMALVKQKHRLLENAYFLTEKMTAHAALQGLLDYPRESLREALKDLLFCEFHDILPGSSIQEVEAYALQRMDHSLEILSRLKTRAFFTLLSGQPSAAKGEYPVFIYNPHPYPVKEIVVCEFQPPEPNFDPKTFWLPTLTDENGSEVALQLEKESSNISCDQRKRIVFCARLKPSQMNRFSCRIREVDINDKPIIKQRWENSFIFSSDTCEVSINAETGLMDRYTVGNMDFLKPGSFQLLVIEDDPDPWGMKVRSFRKEAGRFTLMSKKESAWFAGVQTKELEPIRIIEDGPIRTVVESLFRYNHSFLSQRIKVPKKGSEIELEIRVTWNEKNRMLKLALPTLFADGRCRGQVAYGVEDFNREGEECVAQKWVGVVSSDQKHGLTVINDGTYGFDFYQGELRLSLLRSPAYSGHPVADNIPIVPQDRLTPRIDQGERCFRFWTNAGTAEERFSRIDREALIKNEQPIALCCPPSGEGRMPQPALILSDSTVLLTALKFAEKKDWLIIRLFEPTGKKRTTNVNLPILGRAFDVSLDPFEIKTVAVNLSTKDVFEVDLMEKKSVHQRQNEEMTWNPNSQDGLS